MFHWSNLAMIKGSPFARWNASCFHSEEQLSAEAPPEWELRPMEQVLFHRKFGPNDTPEARVQNSVTPVKVQPSMRSAGTTAAPRKPRMVFRELLTALTPARASR